MSSFIQASLSGGELNPALHGMVDLAFYKNSLKTQRNFITKPYGGIVNRPGSRYIVEFGVGYLRILYLGVAQVYASPGPSAWVTATSYAIGDYVAQSGVYYYCLEAHTSGTFATDLAASKWYALTMVGSAGILEIPTSYTAGDLASLKFTQSADVLTVCHPSYPPMQLSRFSATKWTFQPQTLDLGPFQVLNVDKSSSVWSSANVGIVTLTSNKAIFTSAKVGSLFYLEQKDLGQAWEPGKAVSINDVRRAGGKYYLALTAGTTGQNIPAGTDDHWNDGGVDWSYLHSGFGIARITAVAGDGLSCTATVVRRLPDGSTTPGYASEVNLGAPAQDGNWTKFTVTAHGLPAGFYGTALVNLMWVGYRIRSFFSIVS